MPTSIHQSLPTLSTLDASKEASFNRLKTKLKVVSRIARNNNPNPVIPVVPGSALEHLNIPDRETWFGPPGATLKAKLGKKNSQYQVRALERIEGSLECAAVLLELATHANVSNRYTVEIDIHSLSRKLGIPSGAIRLAINDLEHGHWISRISRTNTTRLNTETIRRAYVAIAQ